MAGESLLVGLLDRAKNVFSLAGELGRAFHEERQGQVRQIDPAGWNRHAPLFNKFCAALLELREPMQIPPDGFRPVAQQLLQAAKLAKGIRDTLARDGGFPAYLDFFPDLNTVCQAGWEAVKEVSKTRRLDDPLAFVDEPAGCATSGFDTTPVGAGVVEDEEAPVDEGDKILVYEDDVFRGVFTPEDCECIAYTSRNRGNAWQKLYRSPAGAWVLHDWDIDDYRYHGRTAERPAQLLSAHEALKWCIEHQQHIPKELESHVGGIDFMTAPATPIAARSRAVGSDAKGRQPRPKPGSQGIKPKRSTERGEGRAKLIAALTKHHQYADGGCLNTEPIGNNELARLAEVSESTASAFFNKEFNGGKSGGHAKYRAICSDAMRLVAALKLLNQEFSPHHLFGAKPANESEREDDE